MVTRRDVLVGGAGALGGAILAGLPLAADTQGAPSAAAPPPAADPTQPLAVPDDPTKVPGAPTSGQGARSPFEAPQRAPTGEIAGSSLTPYEKLTGTITPSDLHFERHHAGIPLIDPARHTLLIHGLVERPMAFSLDDIKRFPQVSRVHFIECSGNGRAAYKTPKPDLTPQKVAGLSANTEWMGVPLATLFRAAGVKPEATWFLAEGSDACMMTRSVPVEKAWDDALVVWAQNGEPLRPAQGYPLRLLLPGWEGNINIKWLRRHAVGDLQVHGPAPQRHGASLQLRGGCQVDHHYARVSRPPHGGVAPDFRGGVERARARGQGGGEHGRRHAVA
jgi:sulfane dehydrogenase subunit SoxC